VLEFLSGFIPILKRGGIIPFIQQTIPLAKIACIASEKSIDCIKKNMKKILVLAFVALSFGLSAQTLRNSSNSTIGSISSDGTVRNSSNSTIGKIESDGTIRNSSNSTIGKIESNGTFRNSSNSTIGKIESDGTVRNSSNSTIGKIESDGTVRNSSNSTIGKAEGVKRSWAAAYFFFDYFKK
jgi:hypothetical protein